MVFLLPFGLATLVGLYRGGRLGNITKIPLVVIPIFVLAFALQVAAQFLPLKWGPFIIMLSYGLLLLAFLKNRHIPGLSLMLLGTVCNGLVMAVNGGRMPVDLGNLPGAEMVLISPKHILLTTTTHLPWLADVFIVPLSPSGGYRLYSVGDFLQMGGLFWVVVEAMGNRNRHKKPFPNTY